VVVVVVSGAAVVVVSGTAVVVVSGAAVVVVVVSGTAALVVVVVTGAAVVVVVVAVKDVSQVSPVYPWLHKHLNPPMSFSHTPFLQGLGLQLSATQSQLVPTQPNSQLHVYSFTPSTHFP
jgi:hypothetical protein